ncbi:helix-turn-helix domain-containing protein [Chryseobacterium gleum]|uniref:helix-turn-helix domain-containing protein n=1 Tax=Chryseobacterium gleum TaxID=250 RepID=UPI001E559B7B|nr:helix-turn-helix domain-containing protein [Chryseobacterium gleum]MCE4064310.1 helix-turn-helix domain-containing protein [Chryseobacterium gleum]
MKNPKPNPEIEAIKASLCKELGYLPGDKIPNSRVSIELGKIDATATLIYAKTLRRPVRKAKEGECQHTIELEKERAKNPKPEKIGVGLLNVKEAAKELRITTKNLHHIKRIGAIESMKIGGRFFFKPEEVERVRIQRAIDKL